jgi:hypothetical protein
MRGIGHQLLVALIPFLVLVGGCGGSAVTTTMDRVAAEGAAVASVRGDVPWVGFSDGELISAMLDSCSKRGAPLDEGPIGGVSTWMFEWGSTRLSSVTEADPEAKMAAGLESLRDVGFGGPDFMSQMQGFAVAVFMGSQHLCPEVWDRQSYAIIEDMENE